MASTCYHLTFRLLSPLHVGWRKVGNIQRTRTYLPGKNLWAALTAYLTRGGQAGELSLPVAANYESVGEALRQNLAFSYFYLTLAEGVALYPRLTKERLAYGPKGLWDEREFQWRFLSSYASTALDYQAKAAEEGSLHEVEHLSPYARDSGEPVFLTGYVIEHDDSPRLPWRQVLHRLQLGGERGYGWGRVEPVDDPQSWDGQPLFDRYTVEQDGWPPVLRAENEAPLLAHALAADFDEQHKAVSGVKVKGAVEPLVGRETTPDGRFGVHVSRARICYAPGSIVAPGARIQIGPYGIWEAVSDATT
jgi:hypothetical protein